LVAIGPAARKEAIPAFIEVVRDESNVHTRMAAINALGTIGPEAKAAVPALKAAAEESERQASASSGIGRPNLNLAGARAIAAAARDALRKIEQ
jgi:HEAT repeat protein